MNPWAVGFLIFMVGIAAGGVLSCTTANKTNAEKCAAAGGTYNSASRSCQMPSELPRR